MKIEFTLNGEQASAEIGSTDLLVDVIRGLGRTGTKEACGVGVCGVCTVMVNDVPVSSCIYLAACADGAEVLTVEGVTAIDRGCASALSSKKDSSAESARRARWWRRMRCDVRAAGR